MSKFENRPDLKPCPICNSSKVKYERTIIRFDLLRCSECNFTYINMYDKDIKEANSSIDELYITTYQSQQNFFDDLWLKNIARKLTNMIGGGKVLDVGCGNGLLLKHFIELKWVAHGLDLSQWAKSYAQKHGYTLYLDELENSKLENDYFDVVTSISTLEHIPQPCQHVKDILRVLKPGGVAYFSGIPNYGSLSVRLNLSTFDKNTPPGHANYFNYESISRLFSHNDIAANIEKVSISSYGIPELHKINRFIKSLLSPKAGSPSDNSVKTNLPDSPSTIEKTSKSLFKRTVAKFALPIYYFSGKPFHMGDKFEIIVIKGK